MTAATEAEDSCHCMGVPCRGRLPIRDYARRHGFQWPPHLAQTFAWLVLLYTTILQFGVVAPSYKSDAALGASLCLAFFSFLFVTLSKVMTTYVDAVAPNAAKSRIYDKPRPKFERSEEQPHVIDKTGLCNVCGVTVDTDTHHCRACNKCTADFDHHCIWLNTCVGRENLPFFMLFLAVANASASCGLIQAICLVTFHFLDKESVHRRFFLTPIGEGPWLFLLASLGVVLVATILPLSGMLLQHVKGLQRTKRRNDPGAVKETLSAFPPVPVTIPAGASVPAPMSAAGPKD